MKRFLLSAVAATAVFCASAVHAGPFILAGTDADDHGSASATANLNGWFFMQRALENLGGGVTNGNQKVTILGSTGSSLTAASSAFNKSSLVGAGWTLEVVTQADFGTFFGNVDADLDTGILMMDSGFNVSGGVNGAAFTSFADEIDTFLDDGGALFSQANGYAWLSALLPGLTATGEFDTGLTLTAAGSAAFPGLANSDLSAGPYHNRFDNFGALSIFATSDATGNAIIIGSAGGSITDPDPNPLPEPTSLLLVGAALAAAAASRRKPG